MHFAATKRTLPLAVTNPGTSYRPFSHVLLSFTTQLWFLHPLSSSPTFFEFHCTQSLFSPPLYPLRLLPHRMPSANLSVSPTCRSPHPFFLAPSLICLAAMPFSPLRRIAVFTPDNPKGPPFQSTAWRGKGSFFSWFLFFLQSCTQFQILIIYKGWCRQQMGTHSLLGWLFNKSDRLASGDYVKVRDFPPAQAQTLKWHFH